MNRRAIAAVVLALAVLAGVLAWLLRSPEIPVPALDRGETASRARPTPPKVLEAPAAAPSSAAEPAPVPSVSDPKPAAAASARDRLMTKEERALLRWGPRGRVVEAGTGAPVSWWNVWMQVRRRDNPAAVETRFLDPRAEQQGDPEAAAAFDLNGAPQLRGDGTMAGSATDALEYRVGARARGHRVAWTPWRPLPQGPGSGDEAIALEPDPLSTLIARVRNADGTPFRGRVVACLLLDDLEVHGGISAETDSDGRARLAEMPSGDFEVYLAYGILGQSTWQAADLRSERQKVSFPASGTAEAEFTVPATGEIAISWTDAGGAPLRGNWTQVKYAGGGGSYSAHVDRIVGLPAGPATVILRVPGYREWRSTATVAFDRVANVEARFEAVGSGR